MARAAIQGARAKLGVVGDTLAPESLERLLEEIMSSYRMFCADEDRHKLWNDLVNFLEEKL